MGRPRLDQQPAGWIGCSLERYWESFSLRIRQECPIPAAGPIQVRSIEPEESANVFVESVVATAGCDELDDLGKLSRHTSSAPLGNACGEPGRVSRPRP